MNFLQITLLLFVLLPIQIFSQSKIVGTVHDEKSKQPIEFASIYINGTTLGTMSDASGSFHLGKIQFPCTLVVSHLGYDTKSIYLKEAVVSPLIILINPKEIIIQGVSVVDNNLRARNLDIFRSQFLGEDVWGRYATIENEDAIQFSKDYQTKQSKIYNKILPNSIKYNAFEVEWSEDSTLVTYKIGINLKASASEPLKINLPLLGYTLHFDLFKFIWQYQQEFGSDLCSILGYSYFEPLTPDSKRDSIRIQNNREKNYYNSAQHFCKSLYEKRLLQNGYKVFGTIIDETTGKENLKEVDMESCLQIKGNYAEIIGLQNRKLQIRYFKNGHGIPVDLTQKNRINGIKSVIVFLNDTCIIRDNGTVTDNSIVFGPVIGSKKIGSILPENYMPTP